MALSTKSRADRPAPMRARRAPLAAIAAENSSGSRSAPASVKRTPGCASASRRTASVTAPASARSERRNFSRAGVAKKRSRTSTCVPPARLAGAGSPTPPALDLDRPGVLLGRVPRLRSTSRATAPIEASASPRKPSVAMAARSSPASFEVQWRATASCEVVARACRSPSSATRIRLLPPAGRDDLDARARRRRARSRRAP